jgi:hypothetical protein
MATPTLGQMRFAQTIMKTEMLPRRRRRHVVDQTWRRIFDGAVIVTFVFFLFM